MREAPRLPAIDSGSRHVPNHRCSGLSRRSSRRSRRREPHGGCEVSILTPGRASGVRSPPLLLRQVRAGLGSPAPHRVSASRQIGRSALESISLGRVSKVFARNVRGALFASVLVDFLCGVARVRPIAIRRIHGRPRPSARPGSFAGLRIAFVLGAVGCDLGGYRLLGVGRTQLNFGSSIRDCTVDKDQGDQRATHSAEDPICCELGIASGAI